MQGFQKWPIKHIILLLTEELCELAKAIRKDKTSITIDKSKLQNYEDIDREIADVFSVLPSLCSKLHISLFEALLKKKKSIALEVEIIKKLILSIRMEHAVL